MPELTQKNRSLQIKTPLGPDKLFVTGLRPARASPSSSASTLDLLAERGPTSPSTSCSASRVTVR